MGQFFSDTIIHVLCFGVCSVIVSGIAPGIFWAGACGITRRAGQKAPTDGGFFCNSLQLAVLDPAKLSGNYQWGRSGATETVSG